MIIAVDFDGILCENEFPEIGEPNYKMISFVRELIDEGHEVILWTSRADARLVEAVEWCKDRGLHFCAVNENAPSNREQYEKEHPAGTRKVYADVYMDDHDALFYFATCLENRVSRDIWVTIIDRYRRVIKYVQNRQG